ncbi:MAG: metallophosphoesterase [Acholeplasmatales bacterium]|nr:metallophosphoesterase [Acholeplasmatales bacterium]
MIKVEFLENKLNKRILVTSDIHGNLKVFKEVLKKAEFNNNDILIIVGDLIEKGDESLNTVLFVRELMKSTEVYYLMGNNDDVVDIIKNPDNYIESRIESYLNNRNSIVIELLNKHGLSDLKFPEYCKILYEKEHELIDFLLDRPHVLVDSKNIYVHAGILKEDLSDLTEMISLERLYFADEKEYVYQKRVVVGHVPVSLYSADCVCNSPYYSASNNILAIDGGNVVHHGGQLNLIEFTNDLKNSFVAYDANEYEKYKAIDPQKEKDGIYIKYDENIIKVIKVDDKFLNGIHLLSKKEITVDKKYVLEYKDSNTIAMVKELSLFDLEVKKGDILSLISVDSNGIYGIVNGFVGYYHGRLEKNEKD